MTKAAKKKISRDIRNARRDRASIFLPIQTKRKPERCAIIIHNFESILFHSFVCLRLIPFIIFSDVKHHADSIVWDKISRLVLVVVIEIPTVVKLLLSDYGFIVQLNNFYSTQKKPRLVELIYVCHDKVLSLSGDVKDISI